jgi:hypothetical protein
MLEDRRGHALLRCLGGLQLRLLLAPVHAAQHSQAARDVNVMVGNLVLL